MYNFEATTTSPVMINCDELCKDYKEADKSLQMGTYCDDYKLDADCMTQTSNALLGHSCTSETEKLEKGKMQCSAWEIIVKYRIPVIGFQLVHTLQSFVLLSVKSVDKAQKQKNVRKCLNKNKQNLSQTGSVKGQLRHRQGRER